MPREALIAAGGGLLSATAAMAFLSGVPGALVIVYLAPLPLFLVGFGLGSRAATIAAGTGFVATGLMGGWLAGGLFGLVQALPAWLVVRLAMLRRSAATDGDDAATDEWYPPGQVLCALTLLGATLLVVAALATEGSLKGLVTEQLDVMLQSMASHIGPAERVQVIDMMAPLFPGAAVTSWVVMTVLNAALAQGALVRLERNIRPSPAYIALQLPQWMSWPLVAAAALALLGSGEMEYMGRNLAMVMAVPYFLLGLAVLHGLAHQVAFTGLLLVSFYLVILISGWAALVVAGIGVLEQWIGLRDRFGIGGATASNENEPE